MKKRITLAAWGEFKPGDVVLERISTEGTTVIVVERDLPIEVPDLPGWREVDLALTAPFPRIVVQFGGDKPSRFFVPEE